MTLSIPDTTDAMLSLERIKPQQILTEINYLKNFTLFDSYFLCVVCFAILNHFIDPAN